MIDKHGKLCTDRGTVQDGPRPGESDREENHRGGLDPVHVRRLPGRSGSIRKDGPRVRRAYREKSVARKSNSERAFPARARARWDTENEQIHERRPVPVYRGARPLGNKQESIWCTVFEEKLPRARFMPSRSRPRRAWIGRLRRSGRRGHCTTNRDDQFLKTKYTVNVASAHLSSESLMPCVFSQLPCNQTVGLKSAPLAVLVGKSRR